MTGVYLAGLAALALVALADLIGDARRPALPVAGYLIGAAASVCFVVAGAAALAGHPFTVHLDDVLGFGPSRLVTDRLSGIFLVIAFGAAAQLGEVGGPAAAGDQALQQAFGLGLVPGLVFQLGPFVQQVRRVVRGGHARHFGAGCHAVRAVAMAFEGPFPEPREEVIPVAQHEQHVGVQQQGGQPQVPGTATTPPQPAPPPLPESEGQVPANDFLPKSPDELPPPPR